MVLVVGRQSGPDIVEGKSAFRSHCTLSLQCGEVSGGVSVSTSSLLPLSAATSAVITATAFVTSCVFNRYVINATLTTNLVLRVAVADAAGASPAGRPAVNVTLYRAVPEVGDGGFVPAEAGHAQRKKLTLDPRCRPTSSNALATSNKGTYLDSGGGSATELVQVEAGEYVAVVSAFSPQEADFVFTVYSAPAVAQVYRMA